MLGIRLDSIWFLATCTPAAPWVEPVAERVVAPFASGGPDLTACSTLDREYNDLRYSHPDLRRRRRYRVGDPEAVSIFRFENRPFEIQASLKLQNHLCFVRRIAFEDKLIGSLFPFKI